jgi:hypothetical protein
MDIVSSFQSTTVEWVGRACDEFNVKLVALDSPLGFPVGMCCLEESCSCAPEDGRKGRACERELMKVGISSYFTTKKTIIKRMIYQAIQWKQCLEHRGISVIEIYPYATKVMLFGKQMPKKESKEGLQWLRERIGLLIRNQHVAMTFNHDECDALLGAYTGLLHLQRQAIAVGDERESTIVIPRQAYDAKQDIAV